MLPVRSTCTLIQARDNKLNHIHCMPFLSYVQKISQIKAVFKHKINLTYYLPLLLFCFSNPLFVKILPINVDTDFFFQIFINS